MQPEARVLVLEVGAEEVLDAAEPVVQRLPAEVQRPRGLGLVPAVGAEGLERGEELVLAVTFDARGGASEGQRAATYQVCFDSSENAERAAKALAHAAALCGAGTKSEPF